MRMQPNDSDSNAAAVSPAATHFCRLCRSADAHRHLQVCELMFGIGGSFDYFECAQCGSLQITSAPTEMSPFYPARYYSYQGAVQENTKAPMSPLRQWARSRRSKALCGQPSTAGRLLNAIASDYSGVNWAWIRGLRATPTSRMLDVGCGAGDFLRQLHTAGFRHLYGVDPFLKKSFISDGLTIINRQLDEIDGQFDAITFHHSLEHMFDPIAALVTAREKLAPNGRMLLRIPLAGCRAWQDYGAKWCQLDAPRHLTIPSLDGLRCAAVEAGLTVEKIEFDSYGFQFWGSEIYRRGLPLIRPDGTPTLRSVPALFSAAEMEEFEHRAATLNASGEGDQACIYLSAR